MNKNLSLLKKALNEIENLNETHKPELKNISNNINELLDSYLEKIPSETAKKIEKKLIYISRRSGYIEGLIFFRALLFRRAFSWSNIENEVKMDLNVFQEEYNNIFEKETDTTLKIPKELELDNILVFFEKELKNVKNEK